MTDLIKRLRKAKGSRILKTVLLGMFDAERTCLEAADALERMTWNTDMDAVPENTPLLVLLKNDNTNGTRIATLIYWDFGQEGEFAWMTTDDMSQIDHWNWTPTKWMHLPPEGDE